MSSAVTIDIYESGVLQRHIEESVIENNMKELIKSLKSAQKNVNAALTTLVEESQSAVADGW